MKNQQMLEVSNLVVKFGNLAAVNDVSLTISKGEVVGLIGPNGAGKTTCFNVITGLEKPHSGRINFKGTDITGMIPHRICQLGMSRTFQVIRAFNNLTVEEVVRVGAYNRNGERTVQSRVDEVIDFMGLSEMKDRRCGDLGLATLRKIEIARAVATSPELLLLDETGAGLNATELSELMGCLKELNRDQGITLCVVEHVMQMVMGICDRIIVLDSGEVIATGNPDEISHNERVIEAYLGKRAIQ